MAKKILKICSTALFVLLMFITLTLVVMKFMGENISVFGYNAHYVLTGSMEPEIKAGDVIISKKVEDASELNVGDVVTYTGRTGDLKDKLITHKIVEKKEENGKLEFVTQGVANPIADPAITAEMIESKMLFRSVFFGKVISVVNNKYGFFIIILLPLAVFLTSETISLVKICKECKEEQVDETETKS